MSSGKRSAFKLIAVLLALSMSQLYVQIGMAAPAIPAGPQRLIAARLTTTANRPIMVNGASVSSGATILTGARLETGDQVGATIELEDLGTLQLGPNTTVVLDFDENGYKVKILGAGCVVATGKKGKQVEVETDQSTAGKNNTGAPLNFCWANGSLSPGTASNVGAGAGAATASAGEGLSAATWWAIIGSIGATTALLLYANRGGNNSPGR
jgi:hypothetical protein